MGWRDDSRALRRYRAGNRLGAGGGARMHSLNEGFKSTAWIPHPVAGSTRLLLRNILDSPL